MLVNSLLDNLLEVLITITGDLAVPSMPAEVVAMVEQLKQYTIDSMPIVWVFLDKEFTSVCLAVALGVIAFEKLYDFIMWVLTKIPAAGISR